MAQDTQCGSADVFKVALFGCNVLQMSAPQPAQSKESKGKGEEEVARKRLFRGTRLCSFTAIGAGHLEPSCLHLPAFPQNRSSFSTYMPVPIQYDFLIFHSISCKHQAIWLGFLEAIHVSMTILIFGKFALHCSAFGIDLATAVPRCFQASSSLPAAAQGVMHVTSHIRRMISRISLTSPKQGFATLSWEVA